MAGNRAIYDRAMEQSREAVRLKRWDEALKNAARAVQEFPRDNDARTTVAIALFHTGKLQQALQLLEEMRASDPENTFYLEYIARAQERQGNVDAALATYQNLVELHQNRRAFVKTIEVLREIVRLRPEMDQARERLVKLLVENRMTADAAKEYMILARRRQQQNQPEAALRYAEQALGFDPENREIKEYIASLHQQMAQAADESDPAPADTGAMPTDPRGSRQLGGSHAQQMDLEKLIADAMEKQQSEDIEGAIAAYEEVLRTGLERADIFYSLGLLYQERGDHEAAVKMLTRSQYDPEYVLSSHFALGSSYTALNQLPQAAQEYEQAIAQVDLETVGKTESEDLIQMYEEVTSIYEQMGDLARAAALFSTLANFLKSKRWGRERAAEFNRRAKELTDRNMLAKLRSLGTGGLGGLGGTGQLQPSDQNDKEEEPEEQMPERWGKIPSIIDYLRTDSLDVSTGGLAAGSDSLPAVSPLEMLENLPATEPVDTTPVTPLDTTGMDEQSRRWVTASERYIEQGLLDAAMDACYEIMLLNPTFLQIHLRIGEILERQKMTDEALAKYQTLIDTYTVGKESTQAIDVYYRYINLAPDAINARSRLAELLQKAGRIEDAAEQIGYLGNSYFRLGQTNRALEEYRRGLQWAPKNKMLRAHYGQALFKLERYEAALSEFHKAANPEDPVAIARINMTLAVLIERPVAVWDSLAAILERLNPNEPQLINAVQAEYRAALVVADDPLLHYTLGLIQQHCGQHSSALLEFEQAQSLLEMEEHPLLPAVLVHQAMAGSYIELEQPEAALDQLRQGQAVANHARIDPEIKHPFARPLSQGELIWQMAEAFAAGGDLPNAEQALREALRHLPDNQNIYTKLADVCFSQGKLDEALTSLSDLATSHENRQNLDKAIEILEYALKLAPGNIDIGARLARLHVRRGYPDKGVEGLTKVAELQRREGHIKDAVASLQQAAEIRWMQNKAEDTLSLYDKIVQIAPNDVEARQWRAIMFTLVSRTDEAIQEKKQIAHILTQRKDYDNAIAELHQIIGLNTQDTEAYFMLGDLLMRRGEYTQALSLYNRLSRMEQVDDERLEALIAAANRMLQNQQLTS